MARWTHTCDRCVQHAVVRVIVTRTSGKLYFCRHHINVLFPAAQDHPGFAFYYESTPMDIKVKADR